MAHINYFHANFPPTSIGLFSVIGHVKLMAGPRCPMMHRFSHKARVDIKNGWLKVIRAALSLSRRLVHNVMFEVDFYFQSLTTTFSCLAFDYTLPRSSLMPLQMIQVPTPSPSWYRRCPYPSNNN